VNVIIGSDPHKSSHTAVVIDGTEQVLAELRLVAGRRQLDQLLVFAERWSERRWAVESAVKRGGSRRGQDGWEGDHHARTEEVPRRVA
jgi:transposase